MSWWKLILDSHLVVVFLFFFLLYVNNSRLRELLEESLTIVDMEIIYLYIIPFFFESLMIFTYFNC